MLKKSVITGIALLALFCTASHAEEQKGVLSVTQGGVEIKKAGSTQWAPAQQGIEVAAGDALKTAPGAVADIRLRDGSYLRLTEGTQITVDSMSLGQEKARFLYFFSRPVQAEKTKVSLDQGQVLATVRKLPNSKSSFRVATPRGIAGVRGTGWGVGESNVFVREGFIDWTAPKASGGQDWLAGLASLFAGGQDNKDEEADGPTTRVNEGLSANIQEDGALEGFRTLNEQQLSEIRNLEQTHLGEVPATVSQKASDAYVHDEIIGPDGGAAGSLDASHGSLSSSTNDEERVLDPEVKKQLEADTTPTTTSSSSGDH